MEQTITIFADDLPRPRLVTRPVIQVTVKHAQQVRTCSMLYCDEPAGIGSCTGSTPHSLCDSCFCAYAYVQFESSLGAYEVSVSKNGRVSAAGNLPCYRFLTGECDCTSIPTSTLDQVLLANPQALQAYNNAKRRQEAQEVEPHREPKHESQEERLLREVNDALSRGGYVECPTCHRHAQKDHACMHMTCPCGTQYCYCCGRRRDDGPWERCKSDGTGCDYPCSYLESHLGWHRFALPGESAAVGALHEFHRRRMAYFLRNVKESYPPKLWRELRRKHPTILDNNPTDGRSIKWYEIARARPPLFGSTTEAELKWRVQPSLSPNRPFRNWLVCQFINLSATYAGFSLVPTMSVSDFEIGAAAAFLISGGLGALYAFRYPIKAFRTNLRAGVISNMIVMVAWGLIGLFFRFIVTADQEQLKKMADIAFGTFDLLSMLCLGF